jgi:hypothetical protein
MEDTNNIEFLLNMSHFFSEHKRQNDEEALNAAKFFAL